MLASSASRLQWFVLSEPFSSDHKLPWLSLRASLWTKVARSCQNAPPTLSCSCQILLSIWERHGDGHLCWKVQLPRYKPWDIEDTSRVIYLQAFVGRTGRDDREGWGVRWEGRLWLRKNYPVHSEWFWALSIDSVPQGTWECRPYFPLSWSWAAVIA